MEVSSRASVSLNFVAEQSLAGKNPCRHWQKCQLQQLALVLYVMNVALYVTTPKDQSQGVLVPLVVLPMKVSKTLHLRLSPATKITSTFTHLLSSILPL
jgi:hypothetical protein